MSVFRRKPQAPAAHVPGPIELAAPAEYPGYPRRVDPGYGWPLAVDPGDTLTLGLSRAQFTAGMLGIGERTLVEVEVVAESPYVHRITFLRRDGRKLSEIATYRVAVSVEKQEPDQAQEDHV